MQHAIPKATIAALFLLTAIASVLLLGVVLHQWSIHPHWSGFVAMAYVPKVAAAVIISAILWRSVRK